MSEKLKPCPFCGGEMPRVHNSIGRYQVQCSCCGFYGPASERREHVESQWNTRAADPAKDAMREALEFTRKFGYLLKDTQELVDDGVDYVYVINPEAESKIDAALALDKDQNDE